MKRLILLIFILFSFAFLSGCGTTTPLSQGLAVTVHLTGTKLPYQSNDIKLIFNEAIDPTTIAANIDLYDKTGSLNNNYTIELFPVDNSNKTVHIKLNDSYNLTESWLYKINITTGLKSINGNSLSQDTNIELITTSKDPFATAESATRNKIIVISDIHMGEERAATTGYCWFTDNPSQLENFLDEVLNCDQIKTLVINGDFFDEWVVPMELSPFQSGIISDEDYFMSVANAPLNKNIVAKINQIANGGKIKVVYVPGNHDMLLTETILKKIIPNIEWHGEDSTTGITAGNGEYWPESSIVIEHGHRYDFFNSPDSLTKAGSLLPPGYFISRIFATKMLEKIIAEPLSTEIKLMSTDIEFDVAWDLAVAEIKVKNLDKNAPIIKMGINGYTSNMSVNDAKVNYDQNIGTQWDQRQTINNVYTKMTEWSSILAGSGIGWWGDLEEPADVQYMVPNRAKIVVFGHSHKGLIKKNLITLEKIYANTGTWVNADLVASGYATRTFLIINPATSSGSEVDTVTLYQYNGIGNVLQLAEESIKF